MQPTLPTTTNKPVSISKLPVYEGLGPVEINAIQCYERDAKIPEKPHQVVTINIGHDVTSTPGYEPLYRGQRFHYGLIRQFVKLEKIETDSTALDIIDQEFAKLAEQIAADPEFQRAVEYSPRVYYDPKLALPGYNSTVYSATNTFSIKHADGKEVSHTITLRLFPKLLENQRNNGKNYGIDGPVWHKMGIEIDRKFQRGRWSEFNVPCEAEISPLYRNA